MGIYDVDLSWAQLYEAWERWLSRSFSELFQPLMISKVPISANNICDGYIEGYDWILNSEYDKRIDRVVNHTAD